MKIILLFIILFVACSPKPQQKVNVRHAGSLMSIMKEGSIGAVASLDSLSKPGIYGLGALDSLRGEFFIENGILYVARVEGQSLSVSQQKAAKATLLVYADVPEWTEYRINEGDLEEILVGKSKEVGINGPFPFMLVGVFPKLDYHVVNYDPAIGDLIDHGKGSFKDQIAHEPVVILGFYSDDHHGIFTHHNSDIHLHVRNLQGTAMGHVDAILLGNNSVKLLLPRS